METTNEYVHEEAPVVEEQLTSEAVTTTDIEIVSGNLNGESAESAAEIMMMRPAADDDVMTRSFIEDESCPGSNPFAAPILQPTPVRNGDANTNGNHHQLNESCDLNRTHELFDGDESSSSINTQPSLHTANGNGCDETNNVNGNTNGNTNGNGFEIDDKIISGLEALKLANQQAAGFDPIQNGSSDGGEPRTWNLLELPRPVNPLDSVDLANADVSLNFDKAKNRLIITI